MVSDFAGRTIDESKTPKKNISGGKKVANQERTRSLSLEPLATPIVYRQEISRRFPTYEFDTPSLLHNNHGLCFLLFGFFLLGFSWLRYTNSTQTGTHQRNESRTQGGFREIPRDHRLVLGLSLRSPRTEQKTSQLYNKKPFPFVADKPTVQDGHGWRQELLYLPCMVALGFLISLPRPPGCSREELSSDPVHL